MANRKVNLTEAIALANQPVTPEVSGDDKMEKAGLAHGSKENLGKISRELERQSYLDYCAKVHSGFQAGEYSADLVSLQVKVNDKGNIVLKYNWRLHDIEVEMPNGSLIRIHKFTVCTWESVYVDLFCTVNMPIVLAQLASRFENLEVEIDDENDDMGKWLAIAKAVSAHVNSQDGIDFTVDVKAIDNHGFSTYRIRLV